MGMSNVRGCEVHFKVGLQGGPLPRAKVTTGGATTTTTTTTIEERETEWTERSVKWRGLQVFRVCVCGRCHRGGIGFFGRQETGILRVCVCVE